MQAIALIGEFNNWDPLPEHWAVKNDFGVFCLFLADTADGTSAIPHRYAHVSASFHCFCLLPRPIIQLLQQTPAFCTREVLFKLHSGKGLLLPPYFRQLCAESCTEKLQWHEFFLNLLHTL